MGSGTPLGALAEMLAATMNPNVGAFEQGAVHVERQVLDWCKEMLGYPKEASGLLLSGASMANLVALAVARNAKADFDIAREGVSGAPRRLTLYGSVEMHSSLRKAAELLGLGSDALRRISVNSSYEIDGPELRRAISQDRENGFHPFCVIGNAGTVNTGAIDDLAELADICRDENLWFHVDGAFGALAVLAPDLRPLLQGLERADSLAFDLHKWMSVPYGAGCVLVRDAELHRQAFSTPADYLAHAERGLSAGPAWFGEYGRLIRQNVEQARYLADLVTGQPDLELLAPVPLNIVCFRYTQRSLGDDQLNELNKELLILLQESGVAAPSSTLLGGRYALRVAITNHRSRREDFDRLIAAVVELGREQSARMAAIV